MGRWKAASVETSSQLVGLQVNIIEHMLDNKSRYCIRLGNEQGWCISATKELSHWANRLAAIMQLEACEPNGYPRLIFIAKNSDKTGRGETLSGGSDDSLEEKLSIYGWQVQDINDIRFWSRPNFADVICEIGIGGETQEIVMMRHSLYPIYRGARDVGGLPLHAGLIERDGRGVLLAAPRNTGKSTCCRRIPKPWYVLCDEETLVVQDARGQYLVHPFPTWSEYLMKRSKRTWNVQRCIPLSAIFFLEQAENDEVVSMGNGEAAVSISNSIKQVLLRTQYYMDREEVKSSRLKLFDNACELARKIPAYRLRITKSGRFWEEIEKVL